MMTRKETDAMNGQRQRIGARQSGGQGSARKHRIVTPVHWIGTPLRTALAVGALVALAATAFAAIALASSGFTVTAASSSQLRERIVANAQGRSLYVLSPENAHHLLCKSSECLELWPPLTVRSAGTKLTAGPGVHGRLAILARGGGVFQVTLNGLPLYRYYGDSAKGEANGQDIRSFGGTWHVLAATG